MKAFFFVGVIALVAIVPMSALQAVLASAASTLFESTPFILAGVLLARIPRLRGARLPMLLGCGCSGGPGALSLPVAAATMVSFGPVVAAARWIAALAVSRLFKARAPYHPESAASELLTLLPFAIGAGFLFTLSARASHGASASVAAAVGAAILAAAISPCGFGAVALAATAHRSAPLAAFTILLIAGVCDLRSVGVFVPRVSRHDAVAYLLAALACALLAWHHGNTLVNPRFVIPLWACAGTFLALCWHHRRALAPALRLAPALMLAMSVLSVPPPLYYASETTLGDAFAGEPIAFHGVLAREGPSESLVRFAVTCCRADAQPVAVRLAQPLPESSGQWIAACGRLVLKNNRLALAVTTYRRTPAPADPFLYR